MNTWNTINCKSKLMLDKAVWVLETASSHTNVQIIEHLREFGESSCIDLAVALQTNKEDISENLHDLFLAGIVTKVRDLLDVSYILNLPHLRKLECIAKTLSQGRKKSAVQPEVLSRSIPE